MYSLWFIYLFVYLFIFLAFIYLVQALALLNTVCCASCYFIEHVLNQWIILRGDRVISPDHRKLNIILRNLKKKRHKNPGDVTQQLI